MDLSETHRLDNRSSETTNAVHNGHLCFVFETETKHRAFMSRYMADALKLGEKILYVTDTSTPEQIAEYLLDRGISCGKHLRRGQLQVLSVREVYLRDGAFDPDRMISLLGTKIKEAVSEGYPGLRFTSEMTWALAGLPGSEHLIEYEERLNKFASTQKCSFLCQYDRRRFSPSILMYAFLTHPYVEIDSALYENSFYGHVPSLIEQESASIALTHCLEKLALSRSSHPLQLDGR